MRSGFLAVLPLCAPFALALDPVRDVIVSWPSADAAAVRLLSQIEAKVVLVPWTGAPPPEFAQACRSAGIVPVAVMASSSLQTAATAVRGGGFGGVAVEVESAEPVRAFAKANPDLVVFGFLKPDQASLDIAPAYAVVREGLWPGVHPVSTTSTSASERPWVDANTYLVRLLRGLYPRRPALLGYRPDTAGGVPPERSVPFPTAELALAEARAAGGNLVVTLPDNYREALLKGDKTALAAWKRLAETAALLRYADPMIAQPNASQYAILAKDLEQAGELLNLAYRQNLCPTVLAAGALPPLDPKQFRAVAAVGFDPEPAARKILLDYARAGGTLVTAPTEEKSPRWWTVIPTQLQKKAPDHVVVRAGAGWISAYLEPVQDPGEFALDLMELPGLGPRDLRIWNAPSVLGLVQRLEGGRRGLILLNYGGGGRDVIMVRVGGSFKKATIRRPGVPPAPLKATPRKSGATEFILESLDRIAFVEFE